MLWRRDPHHLAVYLEKRERRIPVGGLSYDPANRLYTFSYEKAYLCSEQPVALGPELPLTKMIHLSQRDVLFPTFSARLPDKENVVYAEHTKAAMQISEDELDPIPLLGTLGRSGPSKFYFESVWIPTLDVVEQLHDFRKSLNLSMDEVAHAFDLNLLTVKRLSSGKSRDRNTLELLRIYLNEPLAALEKLRQTGARLHSETENRLRRHWQKTAGLQSEFSPSFLAWRNHELQYAKKTALSKPLLPGSMMFSSEILNEMRTWDWEDLRAAAAATQIGVFGLPIGLVDKPHPTVEGVREFMENISDHRYHYWALNRKAGYVVFMSLFEDQRAEKKLFLDVQIERVAEALLRTARFYRQLGVSLSRDIAFQFNYDGLAGRALTVGDSSRYVSLTTPATCGENMFQSSIVVEPLGQIEARLAYIVYDLIEDLTQLFDFQRPKLEFVRAVLHHYGLPA